LNKSAKSVNFKKMFLMFAIGICFTGGNVFASDNVLQAIQIDGVKDSYNIVLKSDDVSEIKKTVQAPNKMILNLKGIRASKTINTIYNNTSSVDSVVVEPTSDDSVKISIQADNVANAGVHFDTLKTPLGVLDKSAKQNKTTDELVLNKPMDSYTPVYNENLEEKETGFSLTGASISIAKHLKNIFKNDAATMLVGCGLFSIFFFGGLKLIKGKDSEIKVGLSQSLKEREIDLYRGGLDLNTHPVANMNGVSYTNSSANVQTKNPAGNNYGLRAYQNGTKSPYASPEIKRQRPLAATQVPSVNLQQVANNMNLRQAPPNPMQNTIQKTAPINTKSQSANIDSMKFLESMTKIYEKNGRSDLAQGLKSNMKKAKMNLA